jgi:hypothetical protein
MAWYDGVIVRFSGDLHHFYGHLVLSVSTVLAELLSVPPIFTLRFSDFPETT